MVSIFLAAIENRELSGTWKRSILEGGPLRNTSTITFRSNLTLEERSGDRNVELVVFLVVLDVGDIVRTLLGVDGDCHLGGGIRLDVESEGVYLLLAGE
jgi:hypothetical protein